MSDYIPVEFLLYIVTKKKTVSRTQNLKYHVKRSDVPEIEPVYRQQIRMETLDCEHYGYRRIKSPVLTMIPSFFKSLYLIAKTRPDWVVTTGR